MSALTREAFTDAQRNALCYALNRAEDGEATARMHQAESFCNGNDDIADNYDGPAGHIARHANARRELDALVTAAFTYGASA